MPPGNTSTQPPTQVSHGGLGHAGLMQRGSSQVVGWGSDTVSQQNDLSEFVSQLVASQTATTASLGMPAGLVSELQLSPATGGLRGAPLVSVARPGMWNQRELTNRPPGKKD